MERKVISILASIVVAAIAAVALCATARDLRSVDTPYYSIHTDLDAAVTREAAVRTTPLVEMFRQRIPPLTGDLRERFPLYLYKSSEEYTAAGGPPGTAGAFVYTGDHARLMVVAGDPPTLRTWHLVQHEGFHQYARAAVGRKLPIWLDEGLAEYFGEAIFTGDGYVTGVIPPWRLTRLRAELTSGSTEPLSRFIGLTSEQWNADPSAARYDQAWSVVQFLLHGDDAQHADAMTAFVKELAGGREVQRAWLDTLGPVDSFETRWRAFWEGQPERPSDALYAQAVTATVTSFLARAAKQGQTFESFDAFRAAVKQNQLKVADDDWLPPALLSDAIDAGDAMGTWDITIEETSRPVARLHISREPLDASTTKPRMYMRGSP